MLYETCNTSPKKMTVFNRKTSTNEVGNSFGHMFLMNSFVINLSCEIFTKVKAKSTSYTIERTV